MDQHQSVVKKLVDRAVFAQLSFNQIWDILERLSQVSILLMDITPTVYMRDNIKENKLCSESLVLMKELEQLFLRYKGTVKLHRHGRCIKLTYKDVPTDLIDVHKGFLDRAARLIKRHRTL
jgi:hypothetical protein